MVYLDRWSNPDGWGEFKEYPPYCKCGSNNTACVDFWAKSWHCYQCDRLWNYEILALPPYYDPSFPYPEIKQ